jgi:4-amino-4-deoxy-L-arabinose transferase-like glycosyltransferase
MNDTIQNISLFVNILFFCGALYYMYRVTALLKDGWAWKSLLISVLARVILASLNMSEDGLSLEIIKAILRLINGAGIYIGFYLLHTKISEYLKHKRS